jgi:hypothetical protein
MTYDEILAKVALPSAIISLIAGTVAIVDWIGNFGLVRGLRRWFVGVLHVGQFEQRIAELENSRHGPLQPRDLLLHKTIWWGRMGSEAERQAFCPLCLAQTKAWAPLESWKLPNENLVQYVCRADHSPKGRWVMSTEQDRSCRDPSETPT